MSDASASTASEAPQAGSAVPSAAGGKAFSGSNVAQMRDPHLRLAFERMMTGCAENIRRIAASPARYALEEIRTERLGAALDAAEGVCLAGIFRAPEWNCRLVMLVDRAFVFTLVELLFGGDGSEPPFRERRPFTEIETQVARGAMVAAAEALRAALAPLGDVTFALERTETRMEFAAVERRVSLAALAKIRFSALGRSGELQVVLPQSALAAIRLLEAAMPPDDESAADPGWSDQLKTEIGNAGVTLRAVLEERSISLAEIAGLRVGQVLALEAGMTSPIRLECDGRPFFSCAIGQANGSYTLRVDEVAERRMRA